MKTFIKSAALFGVAISIAVAQDAAPAAAPGPHGGVVRPVGDMKVEVVIDREGVHVFAVNAQDQPVELKDAAGKVEVRQEGAEPKAADLRQAGGRGPSRLQGRVDLARVPESATTTVRVELTNLPGRTEPATIEMPFRLARLIEYVCPMACVPAQAEAGKCSRCKMDLVAAPFIYACPMHPEVTSRQATDKCWTCKMRLEKKSESQQGGHGAGGGHGGGHSH